ncbi:segregation and condensation protein A [Alkalibacter mobilis]|uniref:segregation and condensation protein A n=1 Tax=Alkalibacter mobilis TaxID=2787712 RepID=UPI00189F02DB|nr:segregation/condensation protein A [Alkalibacter mobilis]MBF7097141.1 segregation/condensation protein A [Alkalibacter mobilis]
MNYEVELEEFQGPFDLLLHLVNKHEIDIFDIPISSITRQYLEYLDRIKQKDLELTSEFILVASKLIEIKSKMLLPVEEDQNGDEIDPREELAQRLYEYKIFKEISSFMKSKEEVYLRTCFKDPEYVEIKQEIETEIDLDELLKALRNVLATADLLKEDDFKVHKIQKETVRIEDKVIEIQRVLEMRNEVLFQELFEGCKSATIVITTFLALLQLIKNNIISYKQHKNFENIIISRCEG